MKKILFLSVSLIIFGLLSISVYADKPGKIPHDYKGPSLDNGKITKVTVQTDGAIYYTDNFDDPLSNDTSSLKARGYLVYYRGGGAQNFDTWFQGNNGVFNAFNGPDTGYVAANFQVVSGANDIDSWLVLPDMDVVSGDIIRFRCRSVTGNPFPDSVRVMYNDLGGTTPESAGWVELGRFEAISDGTWELKSFVAPTSGLSARFAIRYAVVDGGPFGNNSNFMGIDALEVEGQGLLPVELSSFVSSVSGNNITLKWSTASEVNNSGFEVERGINGNFSKIAFIAGKGTSVVTNNYSYSDRNLNSGSYSYRLKQIDFNGNYEYFNLSNEVIIGLPSEFDLSQNYPNPFNPSTKINFSLPIDGKVSLKVFDMTGREVGNLVNEFKTAGYYTVNFNASNVSSGVYYYRLNAGNFNSVKKMIVVK